ncbi:bacteriocin immunity protein, partial [Lactococcus lactis]
MNKTFEKEEILNELYNLILDRNIRDWERQCLLHTKVQLENQGQLADELA